MRKAVVALDIDLWKSYVFRTDTLQEMRGASLILDTFNRVTMQEIAHDPSISAHLIYAHGGSGFFLVDEDRADALGRRIQRAFLDTSQDSSPVIYAVQRLPVDMPEDVEELMQHDIQSELELLRYKLREEKAHPCKTVALSSHPFFRPCDACGIDYAEHAEIDQDFSLFYCGSCKAKREEDSRVEESIRQVVSLLREEKRERAEGGTERLFHEMNESERFLQKSLWDRLLISLQHVGYKHLFDPHQPLPSHAKNLHVLSSSTNSAYSEGYLGILYARVNNIEAKIDGLTRLIDIKNFANEIDRSIHMATCLAIKKHLSLRSFAEGAQDGDATFPFEILRLGNDEVVMVMNAVGIMDVAVTLAQEFRTITQHRHSLSVGVILAPLTYPFPLLVNVAESTLKFALKRSAEIRSVSPEADDNCINFMTVTDGSLHGFEAVFRKLYRRIDAQAEFYATLRPYTPDQLMHLLSAVREGHKVKLGRARLYQLREAIFKMNLTQSVSESLAILRNWHEGQRKLIVSQVFQFGGVYQVPRNDVHDPIKGFPRVTFPWFTTNSADGVDEEEHTVYRTSLLDFAELYDFVL